MNAKSFSESTIDLNPFIQFEIWYKEHLNTGSSISNSVCLATNFTNGRVSVRTVLLKEFSESGFVFFTNYNSKKSSQLGSSPWAALLFYWPDQLRQIRIEGIAEKVSEEESADYFKTRPRESQLAAWASEQSSVIPDRKYLDRRYDLFNNKFENKPVERPQYWGGFRIIPEWFEFWQDGEFRLHDRITYTKKDKFWLIERLAP